MEKVNTKLEEGIAAAEAEAKANEEKNRIFHERAKEIEEEMRAEKELERRFDEIAGKSIEEEEQAKASPPAFQRENIFSRYLPVIAGALKEKAGPAVVEILSDGEKVSELARSAYQALPMPVRLIIKEQVFVEWIASHQDKVIEAIQGKLVLPVSPETIKALPPLVDPSIDDPNLEESQDLR